ncbi:unnamed protein product [Prunus brigantina]
MAFPQLTIGSAALLFFITPHALPGLFESEFLDACLAVFAHSAMGAAEFVNLSGDQIDDLQFAGAYFYRCDAFSSFIKWKAGKSLLMLLIGSAWLLTFVQDQLVCNRNGSRFNFCHVGIIVSVEFCKSGGIIGYLLQKL